MSDKVRVLLIDDSSLVRDLLVKSLSAVNSGVEIVGTAIHGQDGLEKLILLKPDVVVTDMDMPVMNGLEFIRQAMAKSPLPIIVLSSWTQNDKAITLQALEAGAADYISKPSALNPQGFHETLGRLIVKIKAASRVALNIRPQPATSVDNTSSGSVPAQSRQDFSRGTQQRPIIAIPHTGGNAIVGYPGMGTVSQQVAAVPPQIQAAKPNYEERIAQTIIGVGEYAASNEYGKLIKTFALGSCIALNLFSPTFDIAGMVHIALASSSTSPEKAKLLPGYFADTAVPVLINEMRAVGYRKPVSHLVAKIAGGAQTNADTNNYFKIGEKNIAAVKILLQALNISLIAEDVGDSYSRTVFIQVGSKAVHISSPERKALVL